MRGIKMLLQCSHIQQACYHIITFRLSSCFICYSCRRATNFQSILLAECVILLAATFTVLSALSPLQPYNLSSPFYCLIPYLYERQESNLRCRVYLSPCVHILSDLIALDLLTINYYQSWQNYNWCAAIPSRVRNAIANLY